MSYDLDLRSPEFKKKRRLFRNRAPALLVILFLIVVPAGTYPALLVCRDHLQAAVAALHIERGALQTAVEPLAAAALELEKYEERSRLVGEFCRIPLSRADTVEAVVSATPPGVSVKQLAIESCGMVAIDGECEKMRDAAEFREQIMEACAPGETRNSAISISGTGPYTYRIVIHTGPDEGGR